MSRSELSEILTAMHSLRVVLHEPLHVPAIGGVYPAQTLHAGPYRVRPRGRSLTHDDTPAKVVEVPEVYAWERWKPSLFDRVGHQVYLRTVTVAKIGTVVHVDETFVWMHPCCDIVETGAFTAFFAGKKGAPKEYAVTPTSPEFPAPVAIGALITLDAYDGIVPDKGGQ
jgi:hypothetical protein